MRSKLNTGMGVHQLVMEASSDRAVPRSTEAASRGKSICSCSDSWASHKASEAALANFQELPKMTGQPADLACTYLLGQVVGLDLLSDSACIRLGTAFDCSGHGAAAWPMHCTCDLCLVSVLHLKLAAECWTAAIMD